MTIAVTDFIAKVARDLHESDGTFATSEFWTPAEILDYMNYAEQKFLHDTGILKSDNSVVMNGSTLLALRPDNTIDIVRVSFNGKYIRRQTSWDFQKENSNWRSNTGGTPDYWHEDRLPNDYIEVNKLNYGGGTLRIFADYYYDPYTDTTGNIHLDDTWEPYVRWKVLNLALAKDGDSQDVNRAAYADSRYQFGVYLAKRIMLGNPDLEME